MNRIFADATVGRKNMGFGIALFLILGVVVGIPLTVDLFGGSLLTSDEYQAWKVVHGYAVFLSFINYFFGLCIDRLNVPRQQKEIASWSFLLAGVIGGFGRMALVLLSAIGEFGIYASLAESTLFVVGTFIFVRGQLKERPERAPEEKATALFSR